MVSHWNYRVLAKTLKNVNDVHFGIYEVHYDENDEPIGFEENPTDIVTFTSYGKDPVESLKWYLDMMKLALEKPILDYDNFPNVYQKYYRKIKLNKINGYSKENHE